MQGKLGTGMVVGMMLGVAAMAAGKPMMKKMIKKKNSCLFRTIGTTMDNVINSMK